MKAMEKGKITHFTDTNTHTHTHTHRPILLLWSLMVSKWSICCLINPVSSLISLHYGCPRFHCSVCWSLPFFHFHYTLLSFWFCHSFTVTNLYPASFTHTHTHAHTHVHAHTCTHTHTHTQKGLKLVGKTGTWVSIKMISLGFHIPIPGDEWTRCTNTPSTWAA